MGTKNQGECPPPPPPGKQDALHTLSAGDHFDTSPVYRSSFTVWGFREIEDFVSFATSVVNSIICSVFCCFRNLLLKQCMVTGWHQRHSLLLPSTLTKWINCDERPIEKFRNIRYLEIKWKFFSETVSRLFSLKHKKADIKQAKVLWLQLYCPAKNNSFTCMPIVFKKALGCYPIWMV